MGPGPDQGVIVDPDTFQIIDTVEDSTNPCTYSDMTGAGLKLPAPTG